MRILMLLKVGRKAMCRYDLVYFINDLFFMLKKMKLIAVGVNDMNACFYCVGISAVAQQEDCFNINYFP